MIELNRTGCRNPFVKMTEILNSIREKGDPYNARQLCHYWRNYLDPDVYQLNLNDEEKKFIDEWILYNKSENGGIVWKKLRHDLKIQSGLFRSENKLKNYWYSKQRSKKGTNNGTVVLSPSDTIDTIDTIDVSNHTTSTTYSYPFCQYQPNNRPLLPYISYVQKDHNDSTLVLPPLIHRQQNPPTLPTIYPRLQEPQLPGLPPNMQC
ncbi:hypothetical protein RclHR1_05000005 [Rhizophagus clarus]|nr:hypothetical protein RclHR1_05000005 [Rhizophagus clarus]